MKNTEKNIHQDIDSLQEINTSDNISDKRQELLSQKDNSKEIDNIQSIIRTVKKNDSISPEMRIVYLKEFLEYLKETEINKLKGNIKAQLSGYKARLKFMKHLDNPESRNLINQRREAQDETFWDEVENDDEKCKNPEVRDKVNEIEEEFGIDIQGYTNELTLQGAQVFQENLRLVHSMPEYRDILEVVPFFKLNGKETKNDDKGHDHKGGASAHSGDFHLEFNLESDICFSFEAIVHELTHIKDYIYTLNNPNSGKKADKKETKKETQKNKETEKSKIETKSELIAKLELDESDELEKEMIDFIDLLDSESYEVMVDALYGRNSSISYSLRTKSMYTPHYIKEKKEINNKESKIIILFYVIFTNSILDDFSNSTKNISKGVKYFREIEEFYNKYDEYNKAGNTSAIEMLSFPGKINIFVDQLSISSTLSKYNFNASDLKESSSNAISIVNELISKYERNKQYNYKNLDTKIIFNKVKLLQNKAIDTKEMKSQIINIITNNDEIKNETIKIIGLNEILNLSYNDFEKVLHLLKLVSFKETIYIIKTLGRDKILNNIDKTIDLLLENKNNLKETFINIIGITYYFDNLGILKNILPKLNGSINQEEYLREILGKKEYFKFINIADEGFGTLNYKKLNQKNILSIKNYILKKIEKNKEKKENIYKKRFQYKFEKKYLEKGITREYGNDINESKMDKVSNTIRFIKSVKDLVLTYSPTRTLELKKNLAIILSSIDGTKLTKDNLISNSLTYYLDEFEKLLSNPKTSFENLSKVIFEPKQRESLKQMGRDLKGEIPNTENMSNEEYKKAMESVLNKADNLRILKSLFGTNVSTLPKLGVNTMEISDQEKNIIHFLIDFAVEPEKCTLGRVEEIMNGMYILGKKSGSREGVLMEHPTTIAEAWYNVNKNGNIIVNPEMKKAYAKYTKMGLSVDELVERGYIRGVSK